MPNIPSTYLLPYATTTTVYGITTSPGATSLITTAGILPAGLYEVRVQGRLAGTVSSADQDNMQLVLGNSMIRLFVIPPVVTASPVADWIAYVRADGVNGLALLTVGAATAGAIYAGSMGITRLV